MTPPAAEVVRAYISYDPATGVFSRNGRVTGSIQKLPRRVQYWKISIRGKQYLAHRLAWLYMTGSWPPLIDHINGDGLDNRFSNLRVATQSQNRVNAPAQKHSKTKHRGIHLHACGQYRVQLQKNGHSIHVGYFAYLKDAIAARNETYRRVHGEFARV